METKQWHGLKMNDERLTRALRSSPPFRNEAKFWRRFKATNGQLQFVNPDISHHIIIQI